MPLATGQRRTALSEPSSRGNPCPLGCAQGTPSSGPCLCSLVATLEGVYLCFPFSFSPEYPRAQGVLSQLPVCSPTLVSLAPCVAVTPGPPPGICGLLRHPFLDDASPAPVSIPLLTVRSRMDAFLCPSSPAHSPTCFQGPHFPLCRSNHSQIAPLRSGHRRSRAGPEVEEGPLGAEERRSGLLCWLPTPAS